MREDQEVHQFINARTGFVGWRVVVILWNGISPNGCLLR